MPFNHLINNDLLVQAVIEGCQTKTEWTYEKYNLHIGQNTTPNLGVAIQYVPQ